MAMLMHEGGSKENDLPTVLSIGVLAYPFPLTPT